MPDTTTPEPELVAGDAAEGGAPPNPALPGAGRDDCRARRWFRLRKTGQPDPLLAGSEHWLKLR